MGIGEHMEHGVNAQLHVVVVEHNLEYDPATVPHLLHVEVPVVVRLFRQESVLIVLVSSFGFCLNYYFEMYPK